MPSQLIAPSFQRTVDKFGSALNTPHRLLNLAPKSAGNPGNAAALSPAIVLTTISAFEGFAEEFLAVALAVNGAGLAQIARLVGNWNNPTLADWAVELRKIVSPSAQRALDTGPTWKIRGHRVTANGSWSPASRPWSSVLTDSAAWMEVRHLLTHGLATGWRVERWPPPVRKDRPAASTVLRPKRRGHHSLDRAGAKTCANLYSLGARHVAGVVASDMGHQLDWSALPTFR